MTIVCGTDLTEFGGQAAQAGAALASRLGVKLTLVHIIDELGAELTAASDQRDLYEPKHRMIREQAEQLAARFGIEVEQVVLPGIAPVKLVEVARAVGGHLLVLGARKEQRWALGSVAERVAQTSPIPVLVVREPASLEAWAEGDKALRAMVGVELAATSKAALRWASDLRAIGPCDLLVTQVVSPFGERLRLGISGTGTVAPGELPPELVEPLLRDLRVWAGDLPGAGKTTFAVKPGLGLVEAHLALLSSEASVDLLVVGTHQRTGIARFWQGSVSRGVLGRAACNVVCVPATGSEGAEHDVRSFRRVLIPTDFSALANRAIPVGYGLVAAGGVVHLLHVSTHQPGETDATLTQRLRSLVPPGAAARGVTTEIELTREDTACMGIWHASGRLGVDAICMATHGRAGISRTLLGSQAQEVVQRARIPVVLVPPEREG